MMACGRLSPDRKLDQRIRIERNFSFHNFFSLIHYWRWRFENNWPHENGLGGRRSIRNRSRNIPESYLVSWTLLNGEHVSELLV
jgi:hypothetical protein